MRGVWRDGGVVGMALTGTCHQQSAACIRESLCEAAACRGCQLGTAVWLAFGLEGCDA